MITLVIPTIPPRGRLLLRLLRSVEAQTKLPDWVQLNIDEDREGSAATRNRGLEAVTTEWVTFADDDDELMPHHIQTLWEAQQESGADVVYSGYQVIGGTDPRPDRKGKPFDADELRRGSYITIHSLVRTSLAQAARFEFDPVSGMDDHGFYLRLLDLGATFHHVPVETYKWYHWVNAETGKSGNTSGRPDRW